jgi:hypothetical protein
MLAVRLSYIDFIMFPVGNSYPRLHSPECWLVENFSP